MRLTSRNVLATLSLASLVACTFDADERCGPGELLNELGSCVCAANHAPDVRPVTVLADQDPGSPPPRAGCVACAANEEVKNDACVCVMGMVRGASGCQPSDLGKTCASSADCAGGDAPSCRLPEGYCTTTGCSASAPCRAEADYRCAGSGADAYCQRAPQGQGAACTMQGPDPACSAEAPICATNTCHAPPGCQADTDCSPSRRCCDLSAVSGVPGFSLCMAGGCP